MSNVARPDAELLGLKHRLCAGVPVVARMSRVAWSLWIWRKCDGLVVRRCKETDSCHDPQLIEPLPWHKDAIAELVVEVSGSGTELSGFGNGACRLVELKATVAGTTLPPYALLDECNGLVLKRYFHVLTLHQLHDHAIAEVAAEVFGAGTELSGFLDGVCRLVKLKAACARAVWPLYTSLGECNGLIFK